MTQPRLQEHTFASLNLLRGLSAAAVLTAHTASAVSNTYPLFNFNWGAVGSFAVDTFMFISGFLMMWHFYERHEQGELWGDLKTRQKFYIRRFFRIAPLYYVMLVLIYCFHNEFKSMMIQNSTFLHPTLIPTPYCPTKDEPTLTHIIVHFSFLFGFIPSYAQSSYLPDWSIGLEMQFYLFFPFLALLLVRSEFFLGTVLMVTVCWLSLKVFGVGMNATPKLFGVFPYPTLLPFKLECFLAGMLMAAGFFYRPPLKKAFLLLLGLLAAGIYMKKFLLLCFLFSFYELSTMYGSGNPKTDAFLKQTSRIVESRLFKFMADASYGVYLIHVPLLILMIWGLTHISHFAEWPSVIRLIIALGLMVPTIYCLAFLAFKYIESPGIAFGRKLIKKIK